MNRVNVSCGASRYTRAIHETEGIGQAIHPIERVRELWKNGKNSFKEHPVKWIIGGAVVVGIGGLTSWSILSLYRWWSNRAAPATEPEAPAALEAGAGDDAGAAVGEAPAHVEEEEEKGEAGDPEAPAADIEATDSNGWTPLHRAIYKSDVGIIEVLLRAGANKEAKNGSGWTALDLARREGHTGPTHEIFE
jgi:hypothetical protein